MRILSSALCVAALLAGPALTVAPAQAAPRIIVRGATPLLPDNSYNYGGDYSAGPAYFYANPLDPYYDPAGKTPDWRYYGPPAVDLVLARTLDHNGESMLDHMLRCQASFPSYNAATNSYSDRQGLPQICYR